VRAAGTCRVSRYVPRDSEVGVEIGMKMEIDMGDWWSRWCRLCDA
jgi:hypothetical protein